MKKFSIAFAFLFVVCCPSRAEDLTWFVDQAPVVSSILAKVLANTPAFSAEVTVHVSGKDDPSASVAAGTLKNDKGKLRWDSRMSQVMSPQLTPQARAAIRQINGEPFSLLTRPDQQANFLVLPGAHACLESPLPKPGETARKQTLGREALAGHSCVKERLTIVSPDGVTNTATLWKASDLKSVPIRVDITDAGQTFSVRLDQVRFGAIPADQFTVPGGLSRYDTFEDLVQSVLLDKVRRRLGLE